MAQNKRRAPAPRKRRSWALPKLLLIIGYGVVVAFLGIIFLMRQELFRVGIFGDKPAVRAPVPAPAPPPRVTTESQRSAPLSPPRVAKELQRHTPTPLPPTSAAAQPSGEITMDEKKALEDIIRSKR